MFTKIRGHGEVLSELSNQVSKGRFEGAYLFYGPPSIGKFTVARQLAQYLLCTGSVDDSCRCESCRIFPGHPDYLEISNEDETIKVEDVSRIEEFIALLPFKSDRRIVIIDNAENLHYVAANGLLKTLEEIKKHVLIFMVSSRPEKILPTILSRLYTIEFNNLTPDDIIEILKGHGHKTIYFNDFSKMIPFLNGKILQNFVKYEEYVKYVPKFIEDLPNMEEDALIATINDLDTRMDLEFFYSVLMVVFSDMLKIKYDSADSVCCFRHLDELEKSAGFWRDELCIISVERLRPVLIDYKRGLHLKLKHLLMPALLWIRRYCEKEKERLAKLKEQESMPTVGA